MMTLNIEHKEIRGITLKFFYTAVIGIISVTAAIVITYSDLKHGQNTASDRIQVLQNTFGEQQRLQDARLTTIEQSQRQTDIRLTIIETKMGLTNPFNKEK